MKKKANVALITVLMMLGFMVIFSTSLLAITADVISSSTDVTNGILVRLRSKSCLEEVLNKLKLDQTYTGTATITFSDGTCSGAVTNDSNPIYKDVTLTSVQGIYNYTETKKVTINVNPFVVVNS